MNGPTITRYNDFARDAIIMRLEVPGFWLVTARWPRVQMTWWLIKMLWRECHAQRNDGN